MPNGLNGAKAGHANFQLTFQMSGKRSCLIKQVNKQKQQNAAVLCVSVAGHIHVGK